MTRPENGPPVQEGRLRLAEESLMWREVEDEVIVLDKRTWNYMGINGSGAVLWKQIATRPATPAELVKCLLDAYDVDEQTAARDVDAFVAMLRTHDLLRSKEARDGEG